MTKDELAAENLALRASLRTIYDEVAQILDLEHSESQEVLEDDGDE